MCFLSVFRDNEKELHVLCVRYAWRGILPALFLVVLCLAYLLPSPPNNYKLTRRTKRSLKPFLTLEDARYLLATAATAREHDNDADRQPLLLRTEEREAQLKRQMSLRLTVPIVVLALLETIHWMGRFAYELLIGDVLSTFVVGCQLAAWSYTFTRPLFRPTATPPFDLLILLLIQLGTASLGLSGYLYDWYAEKIPFPGAVTILGELVDLVVILILLVVIMSTPLETIDPRNSLEINNLASPEDYTTIWGWMTFGFIGPLIEKGSETTLSENDVFELSPHHRADPLLRKFATVKGKTLMRRIWTANAFDLL